MIRLRLDLARWDWRAEVFLDVGCEGRRAVLAALRRCGCSGEPLRRAEENLGGCGWNNGLTYSDRWRRRSVLVVGRATSEEEYANSIAHEVTHMAVHVAEACGFDARGEEVCYVAGEAAAMLCGAWRRLRGGMV